MVEFKVGDRVIIKPGVTWNNGEVAGEWDGARITQIPRPPSKFYGAVNVKGQVGLLHVDEIELYSPPAAAPPIPADIAERMRELVEWIAIQDGTQLAGIVGTARDILDALKPVDGDLLVARKIALKFSCPAMYSTPGTSYRTNEGKYDKESYMVAIKEAIAKGRELEREGK